MTTDLISSLSAVGPHDEQHQVPLDYDPSTCDGVKHLMETFPDLQTIPPHYVLPEALLAKPVAEAQLPLIDLSGLEDGSQCRAFTVQAISSACSEWGVFRAVNHGIAEQLVADMLEAAEGFFALPVEAKRALSSGDVMNPVRCGTGLNAPAAAYAGHYWRDFLRHHGHPFHSHIHLWPSHPPTYREVTREYLVAVRRMVLRLARAISEGLALQEDQLTRALQEGCQIMAANYYPRCPEPEKTMGMAGHSDHGGLTVLIDNGVGGLQVRHGGAWMAATPVHGSLIVNVGDYLEVFTNGRYKSVEHRAVVNKRRTRISVGVGHGPGLDTIIAPAAQLVGSDDDHGPRYGSVVYKDYVKSQQSSVARGKTALEALSLDGPNEPSTGG
ncbi:hypothetical protein Taro_032506 [Colocasia esculenta]|uniref:Fe2OG dioxygenase domain-containing protein n=1 Tax=Colocasia esculenta TaxID=4460 RepID=A0A843VZB9_COLES|nr:hypothetical protein [Colocasia esculenta]